MPSLEVFQFKITLRDVHPPIWRRIQVPKNNSFWDLHVAIQDSMGWKDYHLHEFEIHNPRTRTKDTIGIPDEDNAADEDFLPGWEITIADYFSHENLKAIYTYDFGDGWQHSVLLEEIHPYESGVEYPRCIAGKRACPPEDCGGPYGYDLFLEAIRDTENEDHDHALEWIGGSFDPEHFDSQEVTFDDPHERWSIAFEEG